MSVFEPPMSSDQEGGLAPGQVAVEAGTLALVAAGGAEYLGTVSAVDAESPFPISVALSEDTTIVEDGQPVIINGSTYTFTVQNNVIIDVVVT